MALDLVAANSERVECGTSSLFDMGSGDLSLMVWLQFTGNANMDAIGKMRGGNGATAQKYTIQVSSGSIFGKIDAGSGNNATISVGGFNDNLSHYVALVRDNAANVARLYVNGVEQGTASLTGVGSTDQSNQFLIGAGFDTGTTIARFWNEDLEDGRLYNRALSAAEIATIYSARGHDGIVDSIVARWMMNEGPNNFPASGAGVIKDSGPNGLDGTPVNTPVWENSELSFRKRVQ